MLNHTINQIIVVIKSSYYWVIQISHLSSVSCNLLVLCFRPKLKLLYNALKEKLGLSVMFKLFEERVINVVSFQKKIVVSRKIRWVELV